MPFFDWISNCMWLQGFFFSFTWPLTYTISYKKKKIQEAGLHFILKHMDTPTQVLDYSQV